MKQWLTIGLISLFTLVTLPAWSSETKEDNDEVEWTFEDAKVGAVPEKWTIGETSGVGTPATWKVIEMAGAPSGNHVFALTETKNHGRTFNVAIAKGPKLKDLEIEVKVKAMTGKEDQGGGPIWRVIDADNYYICRWNPLENNFRVYYVKDGRRRQIATANVETDPAKWHEIEIEMEGSEIEASFDGKKLIEVEDSTFTEAGMVGLWTKADAASAFDDLEVEPSDEDDDDDHDES